MAAPPSDDEDEGRKPRAVLHLFCGRIASGKTSLARQIASAPSTVLISEDHLLSRLFPGEIVTLDDYRRSTLRLRRAIGDHVQDLLRAGINVVLDFQANTPGSRAWMRELYEGAEADHRLHYLRASDTLCRRRLSRRNASGTHEYQVSEADFELFNRHFVAPGDDEGFKLLVHDQD